MFRSNITIPFGDGQTTATPSVFGAPTPTTGPFGTAPQTQQTTFCGFGTGQATTGPFGSSTNTSPFGKQSTNANTGGDFSSFSTVSATSGFGSLTTTPYTHPFGSTNQSTSVFWAKPLGTGFGTSTSGTNAFNTAPNNSSIFGASNTMTIGGTGFGSAPTPASTGLFGSNSTTPGGAFGQNTSSTSSVFGGQSMNIGTAFGSNPLTTPGSSGLFGNTSTTSPSTNVFGQINPSTTVFGGFGATTPTTPGASTGMFSTVQTPQQSGMSSVPYEQTSKQDGNTTISMQAITAMSQYEGKSFEELRYEDYMSGNRGTQGQQQAVSSFGGLGTFSQPNPSTSLFGTQPLGTSFSTSGSFVRSNAPTNSTFGAPTSSSGPTLSGGLFGSTQTTNAFTTSTSSQPTTAFFGAPTPTRSQALSSGVFGFTQGTTTFSTSTITPSLFGGTTEPLGFGVDSTTTNAFEPSSQTTSHCGAPATNGAPSFGGFVNVLATSTTAGAPAAGLFGTAALSTGTELFGASITPASQGGTFFGTTSTTLAPIPGRPTSSTGDTFGASTKPVSSSLSGWSLFGSTSSTGTSTNVFSQSSKEISLKAVLDDRSLIKKLQKELLKARNVISGLTASPPFPDNAQSVMESYLLLAEKYERISRYSDSLTESVTKLADSYICPITLEVMKDPVICSDGHSYERSAIERWLQTSRKSPITNKVLSSRVLIPNIAVRAALESIQEVEYARKDFADSKQSACI